MSCRHDLALGTCARCYPSDDGLDFNGYPQRDPGPEEDYAPNLDGPGAVPKVVEVKPSPKEQAQVIDLMDALRRSFEHK